MSSLHHPDLFADRHIGPRVVDQEQMLKLIGYSTLKELIDDVVPESIRLQRSLDLPPARSEVEVLNDLKEIAKKNQCYQNFIGMGYYGCYTPSVILRNILENPGWYTQLSLIHI